MSLDKAIEHGKEKREPYRGAKAVDCTCRNGGTCPRCMGDRLYQRNKVTSAAKQKLKEFESK